MKMNRIYLIVLAKDFTPVVATDSISNAIRYAIENDLVNKDTIVQGTKKTVQETYGADWKNIIYKRRLKNQCFNEDFGNEYLIVGSYLAEFEK